MTKDEALAFDLALEALEGMYIQGFTMDNSPINKAITAIKQSRSAPVQGCDFCSHSLYAGTRCKHCGRETAAQPAPVQEPVAWKNAAIRLGEELSSVGPDGYYDMTAEQWLDWTMDQRPRGKNSLPATQRQWVGLSDDEMTDALVSVDAETKRLPPGMKAFAQAIEAKLKEKNK